MVRLRSSGEGTAGRDGVETSLNCDECDRSGNARNAAARIGEQDDDVYGA